MSEHTVAIIQARMGSTRFPGKMTALFRGQPILSWVIQRLQRCTSLDSIILATSDLDRDLVLFELAQEHGVMAFRGDEQNVLARFVGAAEVASADQVVRVCADNPLVAPEAIDQLVAFFKAERPDYAYNHVPKGDCKHPDGFGAEILSASLLREILVKASEPSHLEHVTSYIWDHFDRYDIRCPECPIAWITPMDTRFDVDHAGDLARLEAALPGITVQSSIGDVLDAWEHNRNEEAVQ